MVAKITGGASSAVAASTHAACARFRGTDPLVTSVTRRELARQVGHPDSSGGIPDARWMRAMIFERLVRDERFASEVATTAVGRLELARPSAVAIVNAGVNLARTAELLAAAHQVAVAEGVATMLHGLALPFAGFEAEPATEVKPDFAVVAPKVSASGEPVTGSWLIIGDAKDYERVRSRVDDRRLLKGFLQVALGAESAARWSKLPAGQEVHRFGVLAVPRNAFLQPEALVEDLGDHRAEVRLRVEQRRAEASTADQVADLSLPEYVRHLKATFDPAGCVTCSLFSYCRNELRRSGDPTDLLVEIGVPSAERAVVAGLIDGNDTGKGRVDTRARLLATLSGVAQRSAQRRVDPAGLPGTVNVVLAKSDSAALGVYGISTQKITGDGPGAWVTRVFADPQSAQTRRTVMGLIGAQLSTLQAEQAKLNPVEPAPVHLVVPDQVTGDVLASIADNLAGIELSRLRWQRDLEQGRPALTYNGDPATLPTALTRTERLGVSFLLEEDRARPFGLRTPVLDLRAVLARHVVAGGPESNSGRLDYLLGWAEASQPVDHRSFGDQIEASEHTPGARLSNRRSDAIHHAQLGHHSAPDPARYDALIREELAYKAETVTGAVRYLATVPDSLLRGVHRTLEGDAQTVWRRRLALQASDLVRFGRTYRWWRNAQVKMIDDDRKCQLGLQALGDPHGARLAAEDSGTRELALARVKAVNPLVLQVDSRRIGEGSRVVALHVDGAACVEQADLTIQAGSFKFRGLAIGPLNTVDELAREFAWSPATPVTLAVGDEVVLGDFDWFCDLTGLKFLNVKRPGLDSNASPTLSCGPDSYATNPDQHKWCCRPHEVAEAQFCDDLAERRERGELNPQVWPPVIDHDAFEVSAADAASGDQSGSTGSAPDETTLDDLE